MTRRAAPAQELVTDWIPCTTPPVRDGVYDLSSARHIGVLRPIRMAYTNGEWRRMDGRVFLMAAEIKRWSWRGVRRWVLVRKADPLMTALNRGVPVDVYLISARPRNSKFGGLGSRTRPFKTERAAQRFADSHARLGLTAVLP